MYARHLRQVAHQVDVIVRGIAPDGIIANVTELIGTLNYYGDLLRPWAGSVVSRMVADVSRRDAAAWAQHGRLIGRSLRREIETAPTGVAMRKIMAEQIESITSIPRDAAERLQRLNIHAVTRGIRASEIAKDVLASGEVSKSTAMMLARTGVSSTATAFTRSRAEYVGSRGYIWRTSRDGDVRKSHKEMEGQFVEWGKPPHLDGFTGHCGEFANCRCFPEVVLPERTIRA